MCVCVCVCGVRESDLETAAMVVDVPMGIPPEIRMLAQLEEEGRRRHHQHRPRTQKLVKSCRHIVVWNANDGLEASSLSCQKRPN